MLDHLLNYAVTATHIHKKLAIPLAHIALELVHIANCDFFQMFLFFCSICSICWPQFSVGMMFAGKAGGHQ